MCDWHTVCQILVAARTGKVHSLIADFEINKHFIHSPMPIMKNTLLLHEGWLKLEFLTHCLYLLFIVKTFKAVQSTETCHSSSLFLSVLIDMRVRGSNTPHWCGCWRVKLESSCCHHHCTTISDANNKSWLSTGAAGALSLCCAAGALLT